jgi:hypothetical protein
MTRYVYMYGKKKDVSKFRAFGYQACMYLNEKRRGKGKHIPRAVEAIKLYIPSTRCAITRPARLFHYVQALLFGDRGQTVFRAVGE